MYKSSIPMVSRMNQSVKEALEIKGYLVRHNLELTNEDQFYCGVIMSDCLQSDDDGKNKCLIAFIDSTPEIMKVFKDKSKKKRFNNKVDRLQKMTDHCVVIRQSYWNTLKANDKGQFLFDSLPYYFNTVARAKEHIRETRESWAGRMDGKWSRELSNYVWNPYQVQIELSAIDSKPITLIKDFEKVFSKSIYDIH